MWILFGGRSPGQPHTHSPSKIAPGKINAIAASPGKERLVPPRRGLTRRARAALARRILHRQGCGAPVVAHWTRRRLHGEEKITGKPEHGGCHHSLSDEGERYEQIGATRWQPNSRDRDRSCGRRIESRASMSACMHPKRGNAPCGLAPAGRMKAADLCRSLRHRRGETSASGRGFVTLVRYAAVESRSTGGVACPARPRPRTTQRSGLRGSTNTPRPRHCPARSPDKRLVKSGAEREAKKGTAREHG